MIDDLCFVLRRRKSLACLLLLLTLSPGMALAAELRLLATIQPLGLMAKEIGGEQVEVRVLLKPQQSPHDFSFSVSQRRQLDEAQLVLWVGPALEPWLQKIIAGRDAIALQETIASPEGSPQSELAQGGHTAHTEFAAHPWLAPAPAIHFIWRLADRLGALLPQHRARFQDRARQLVARVNSLRPTHTRGSAAVHYAVAHDAYGQFVAAYDLPEPMVLSESTRMAPGLRTLHDAAQRLPPGSCLLVDGNHRRQWVSRLAEDQRLRLVQVDIMGADNRIQSYSDLLAGVLRAFESCL